MHLPLTVDEYREDLRRFMRVAITKQARLVVFPELGGVMVAPPILGDFRSQLLKRADRGRRRQANLWHRVAGSVAGAMASVVGADFRRGLAALLDVAAQELWRTYGDVFGGLAKEFGVTVIAPSAYLPDPVDGVIRNMAVVYNSSGEMVGRQAKVVLHPADADLAHPGSTWDVISTEVGQIGLILGSDVLYPEVGRLLAYQGAEMLVVQAACTDELLYQKIRAGALARMQDNQLFAAVSFLVGENRLSKQQRSPFAGKSAILAPQELTPRKNGVLVEMGNLRSEGVLAAEWDFAALRALWDSSDTPVRHQLPLQQAGQVLAQLYARLQALPKGGLPEQLLVEEKGREAKSLDRNPAQSLDDLVVIATVTHRWPLPLAQGNGVKASAENQAVIEADIEADEDFVITADDLADANAIEGANPAWLALPATGMDDDGSDGLPDKKGEDETDEMDAVAGADKGR
jgi:predicted amidohydrolase